jgi:hypothetical protein
MKAILTAFLLISFLNLSYASERCGKVEILYYKAYLDMPPKYNGIVLGLSGQRGNVHNIPDSTVPLAVAAKAHGLVVCYTVKLDQAGRVYIEELKLK